MHIAIDDFGTGYSSLSYLKRWRVDTLKIDRSFVRDLVTDMSDLAIVSAIIAMAKHLHIKVVAEGIEGWPQLEKLRQLGCSYAQGYLFARPAPPADCLRYLIGRSRSISPSACRRWTCSRGPAAVSTCWRCAPESSGPRPAVSGACARGRTAATCENEAMSSSAPTAGAGAPRQQCADAVLMVRPAAFGFNPETAATNTFQKAPARDAGRCAGGGARGVRAARAGARRRRGGRVRGGGLGAAGEARCASSPTTG